MNYWCCHSTMGKPSKLEEMKRHRFLLLFLIPVYELQCSQCSGKLQQDFINSPTFIQYSEGRCRCKGREQRKLQKAEGS